MCVHTVGSHLTESALKWLPMQLVGTMNYCSLFCKCWCPVQERAEQALFPEDAGILQHLQQTPLEVLPVCQGQCLFLHNGVLLMQWYRKGDIGWLDRLVEMVSCVVGVEVKVLALVVEESTLRKLMAIMNTDCHPLHCTLTTRKSVFSVSLLSLAWTDEQIEEVFCPWSHSDLQCYSEGEGNNGHGLDSVPAVYA